jgi:hypothetical protein
MVRKILKAKITKTGDKLFLIKNELKIVFVLIDGINDITKLING